MIKSSNKVSVSHPKTGSYGVNGQSKVPGGTSQLRTTVKKTWGGTIGFYGGKPSASRTVKTTVKRGK